MRRPIFSFPNPVNEVAARTVASGVVVMAALALGTGSMWLTIPLAYGFVARVAAGPRFSPLGRLATTVVAPRMVQQARLVPGPPKRFAQGIGALFTVGALCCWLAHLSAAAEVLLALLLVPAILEAALGYCVGCQIFGLLMRRGVIPTEICAECADLMSHSARHRAASGIVSRA